MAKVGPAGRLRQGPALRSRRSGACRMRPARRLARARRCGSPGRGAWCRQEAPAEMDARRSGAEAPPSNDRNTFNTHWRCFLPQLIFLLIDDRTNRPKMDSPEVGRRSTGEKSQFCRLVARRVQRSVDPGPLTSPVGAGRRASSLGLFPVFVRGSADAAAIGRRAIAVQSACKRRAIGVRSRGRAGDARAARGEPGAGSAARVAHGLMRGTWPQAVTPPQRPARARTAAG